MNTLSILFGLAEFRPAHTKYRVVTHLSEGKATALSQYEIDQAKMNRAKILSALDKGYSIASLIQPTPGWDSAPAASG